MHFISVLALLAATASSTVVQAALIKVQVGKNSTGGLATVFNPNQVTAQVGDMIQFEFMGKNHSATQSSFAQPCTRQLNTALNLAGADSGFMPVSANATKIPTWTIQVNNAKDPQWFFCNQAKHCNAGMVFAINAPATGAKSFEAYLAKAKNATHPDAALNQTAPFTPPAVSSSSSSSSDLGSLSTTSTSASASASPTDAPTNAAPGASSSSSASVSGTLTGSSSVGSLSLSASTGRTTVGTAAADRVSTTSTGTAAAASSTSKNAAQKIRVGAGSLQVAVVVVALGSCLL